MALSNLAAAAAATTGSGGSTYTIVTPSFTPAANALVVLAVGYQGLDSTIGHFAVSADSIGGLAWTKLDIELASSAGGGQGGCQVWYAVAGASPPTGTVTFQVISPSGTTRCTVRPYTLTGQAASPIGVTGGSVLTGSSGTFTMTLSGAPASTSEVIYVLGGYINAANPTITDDAAFTRVSLDGTDFWSWLEVAYCNGSAPSAPAPSYSASSAQSNAGIAFEVSAPVVAAPLAPHLLSAYPSYL